MDGPAMLFVVDNDDGDGEFTYLIIQLQWVFRCSFHRILLAPLDINADDRKCRTFLNRLAIQMNLH